MSKIVLTDAASTPTGISSGTTALYTKSGGGPGTDGLYYKQGAATEVGPIIAGGTVNNLQDAYDGGASIATTVALGAVSISSTLPSGPDALAVTVGGSTNATGVLVENSGPGAAVVATALGSGNAVEVESSNNRALNVKVNGTGLNARGLAVDLTASGSAGTGIEVSMNSSGSGVSIQQAGSGHGIYVDSSSVMVATVRAVAAGAGSADAIRAQVTDPASAGAGLKVEQSGTGKGIDVEVSSPSTNVAGAHIEFTNPSNTGPGILVENDPASTSKFVGIQVQAATGTGGSAIIARNLGSGSSIYAQKTGTGSEPVVEIASSNLAATGAGVEINVNSSPGAPGQVIRIDPAATANAIEVRNPAAVFTVDRDGDTTTPSVTFNGGGTVTVRGDTGTPGDPINPRIELTSGPTNVGSLTKTHTRLVLVNGFANLDLDPQVTSEQPTTLWLQHIGAIVINLPSALRYPTGTEIFLLNTALGGGSGAAGVAPAAGSQALIKADLVSPDILINVPLGTGARFLSCGVLGWVKTGTF